MTHDQPPPRILIIAGSDSGGGAGIQGDIKTVTCLGGYAATAITALTAQNTQGVFGVHDVPPDFVARQIALVLTDIGADAIKTGMLHRADVIEAIATTLQEHARRIPLIVDPVMVAKGGASLMESSATQALHELLIPMATLITPNIPEAEALLGMRISTTNEMHNAAQQLLSLGAQNVLLKGGHLEGSEVVDILVTKSGQTHRFTHSRLHTRHTHGTGCTLASSIATFIGQGLDMEQAVARAGDYVHEAMKHPPGLGKGHGPLGHNWCLVKGT